MAGKQANKKVRLDSFAYLHKCAAGVALLAFFIIVVAGMGIDAPFGMKVNLIIYRTFIVILVIKLITFVVVRILKTYEEMNSGQA